MKAVVIDYKAPTYQTDAGALDTFNMLIALLEFFDEVTFLSTRPYSEPPDVYLELRQKGVRVINFEANDFVDFFQKQDFADVSHFFLYRPGVAYATLPIIRKKYLSAKIFYFTVDLHHLRMHREYKLTGNSSLKEPAENYKRLELSLISAADFSMVVSDFEREYLIKECSVDPSKVVYMPIYRPMLQNSKKFAERDGVIFIGGFLHQPNVDGLNWFIQKVLPLLTQLPGKIGYKVYGSNMPDQWKSINIPNFEFVGFKEDLTGVLETARVTIAPLRYGAGIKGKVVQSICSALPCVCTSTAAEGMSNESSGLIVADSHSAFAAGVHLCHENENFWNNSFNQMIQYRENFSRERFLSVLRGLVST